MPHHLSLNRRHFIVGVAGTGALTTSPFAEDLAALAQEGTKPLPDYAAWKNADAVIVHTKNTLETKRDAFGTTGLTSSDELYVRNNLPAPGEDILTDRAVWSVAIDGVQKPQTMNLGQLERLGIETVACVLQCSGNGRAFFDHKASGTQWSVGAAGNVFWSGVPVRAVVDALGGVTASRKFMTGTGGEKIPQGVDPKSVVVERSVPIAAVENAILAWEMNGRPIPIAHGGPLRLVIPGYYGINNIKYLSKLAFTDQESDAQIQRTGYRVRPVGVKGAPSQQSMWQMTVKSWVTHPLRDTESGPVQIYGVAFGGDNPVKNVDVSTDGGATWKPSRFIGPDLGPYAWRPFVLAADLKPGRHTVASRATDSKGNTQPADFEPNERGYGHNGWRAHAVDVTVV